MIVKSLQQSRSLVHVYTFYFAFAGILSIYRCEILNFHAHAYLIGNIQNIMGAIAILFRYYLSLC
jgi:hypothetical protein